MAYLYFAGGTALVVGGLYWLMRWTKRSGRAGAGLAGTLAAYDEAYHTTAHQQHHEQRVAKDRKAQAGSPDDL